METTEITAQELLTFLLNVRKFGGYENNNDSYMRFNTTNAGHPTSMPTTNQGVRYKLIKNPTSLENYEINELLGLEVCQ